MWALLNVSIYFNLVWLSFSGMEIFFFFQFMLCHLERDLCLTGRNILIPDRMSMVLFLSVQWYWYKQVIKHSCINKVWVTSSNRGHVSNQKIESDGIPVVYQYELCFFVPVPRKWPSTPELRVIYNWNCSSQVLNALARNGLPRCKKQEM